MVRFLNSMGEMSQSDIVKVYGRLWRVGLGIFSALVLVVIVVGVFVQRGCSRQAREVTWLRRVVNGRELIGSYQWYSPTNIFVLGKRRNNAAVYSLNVETGVQSQFEWLIPYVSKGDLRIFDWAISWPLQRLSVISEGYSYPAQTVSSFDLKRRLEQHSDVENRDPGYVYLPLRDSWVAMFGSAKLEGAVMFYTAQQGLAEIKPSPVVSGRILGASGDLMFVLHTVHSYFFMGRLEIDALRLGDDVTLEKHYTVMLAGLTGFNHVTPSPDGKWLIVDGSASHTDVVLTGSFPFVFSGQTQDEVFLAVNLESSTTINILKRIKTAPYNYGAHTPRWLLDGKSVSIVVDGELRVWKLFD